MRTRRTKKTNTLRNVGLVILITGFFIFLLGQILTHPATIRYVLDSATAQSKWNIEFADFDWNFFSSSLQIKELRVISKNNPDFIEIDSFSLNYRPWDILRAKFYVRSFLVKDIKLHLTKKQKKREITFDIARLLILQSIIINKGVLKNADLMFPGSNHLRLEKLELNLSPTLFGATKLGLKGANFNYRKKQENKAALSAFNLEAVTRLSKWGQDFPYINDLKGRLSCKKAEFSLMNLDSLQAELELDGQKLNLDTLKIVIGDKSLIGSLQADLDKQTWQTELNIPKPLYLPFFGKPIKTLDTAGWLSGFIKASGTGFNILKDKGKAEFELKHKFNISKQYPLKINTNASWNKGVFKIAQAELTVQESAAKITGFVDVNQKQMNLKIVAQDFPAQAGFDKFENDNFHKIYGKTDFECLISGWGKNFKVLAEATTYNGGYLPMQAEKIKTKVEASYDKLFLDWLVFEQNKQTANAQLTINFGPKIKGKRRRKDLNLVGSLNNHPLEPLLPNFGISGLASGDIKLTGEVMSFQGQAKAKIINGNLLFIPFDEVSAALDISKRKIIYNNLVFKPHTVEAVNFEQPIQMDLQKGEFDLAATTNQGLDTKISYKYDSKKWTLKKLNYVNPDNTEQQIKVNGFLVSKGPVKLNVNGELDLSLLAPLGYFFRDVGGKAQVDLMVSGNIKNPALDGEVELMQNLISLRQVYLPMENMVGALLFKGHDIFFNDLKGYVQEGSFKLSGQLTHQFYQIKDIDISFSGKNLTYRTEEGSFRSEFEGSFDLKGRFPSPLLKGELVVLDGRYTKDFNLLEQVTKKDKNMKSEEYVFNPKLDLHLRNTGELLIKNNVGDISLRADLDIRGTRKKPLFAGSVDVVEGELHYLGLEFEITRGFIEFRGENQSPYLEAVGQKEIEIYNVVVEVFGNIDNLDIELSATSPTGPLEKRDIISLLAFGMTETEREQLEASKGGQFGVSMAAQQLTHIVERPVSKFTRLDTFRLEASETEQIISRVSIGKQISDRLTVDFTTDINTTNAVQTLEAEYLFTDNLLLKGSRSTDDRYEISGILRFRFR